MLTTSWHMKTAIFLQTICFKNNKCISIDKYANQLICIFDNKVKGPCISSNLVLTFCSMLNKTEIWAVYNNFANVFTKIKIIIINIRNMQIGLFSYLNIRLKGNVSVLISYQLYHSMLNSETCAVCNVFVNLFLLNKNGDMSSLSYVCGLFIATKISTIKFHEYTNELICIFEF